MPALNGIRMFSPAEAFRVAILSWKSNAARSASIGLPNSAMMLSPAAPNVRPPNAPQLSTMMLRRSSNAATADTSSRPIRREKPTASIEIMVAS
jgi:hypothetical protein